MRIATLDLTPELFIEFCKASKRGSGLGRRFVVKENPLPDDAEIVRIGLASLIEPYTLRLYIQSQEFAEVPEGQNPPALPNVLYETVYDKAA